MAIHWDEIDRLVQAHRVSRTTTEADLIRQLRIWWCIKYNKPFKEPLLDSYTLDDLIYEYLYFFYLDPEHDPAEKIKKEDQFKKDEEWARKMLEKHVQKEPPKTKEPEPAPTETQAPSEPMPESPPDISTSF